MTQSRGACVGRSMQGTQVNTMAQTPDVQHSVARRRVLVIDDDQTFALLAGEILEQADLMLQSPTIAWKR